MTAAYRCPTPCDDDCELHGWGCHEAHGERKRWEHDAEECERRTWVEGFLRLLDAGWSVNLRRPLQPADPLEPFGIELIDRAEAVRFRCDGASSGETLARAVDWSMTERITP